MSRRPTVAASLLLALLITACTPKIDPSTPETTEASIEKIQNRLSDAEREQFSNALGIVIATAMGGGYKDVGDTPEVRKRVRAALDGKSAKDIIAEADRIKQQAGASGRNG
jgi:hypothetical protein